MERPDTQRWMSQDVARLISIFESDRRFYDEIITLLPVPLATMDFEGNLLSANRAFLREFGLRREELDRKALTQILKTDEWRKHLATTAATTIQHEGRQIHLTPVSRWERGETEWVVVLLPQAAPAASEPAPDPSAAPELIANAAAVESAQRLAARVTHETNNLIMIASGYGREILSQLPADSPLRDDVSMLLGATERIEAMAAQLNEFSRTARNESTAFPLRDILPQTGYQLPATIPDCVAVTDRTALAAVFACLPPIAAGPLSLEVSITDREAVLTVKGFGISAESLRQQFEVLNKAAREGKPGAREAALVGPRLAQAGVRWRVTDAAALELHLKLSAATTAPGSAQTALVVDDQAGIRTIVRRILEGRGFQVVEAGSGEEALSLLDRRREVIELLVTDMRMPGMTGRDLADRVRFRYPATRILFISGFTDDPSVQSGLLPEHARFLAKPFHPDQLIDSVTKLMDEK